MSRMQRFLDALKKGYQFYVPVYSITLLIFKKSLLQRSPGKTLLREFISWTRSALLASWMSIFFQIGLWLYAKIVATGNSVSAFYCGVLGSFGVLAEATVRRCEMAVWLFPRFFDAAMRFLSRRGYQGIKHWRLVVFILATSTISYAKEHGALRSTYTQLLQHFLGNNQTSEYQNQMEVAYSSETPDQVTPHAPSGSFAVSFNLPNIPTNKRLSETIDTTHAVIENQDEPGFKKLIENFLDSNSTTIFMTIITIYALFGDDVRVLAFTKNEDDWFFGISVACLIFFALELLLSCFSKVRYLNSFYFWLDLIATMSLIPDIGWIWNPIIGVEEDDDEGGSSDAEQIQNAGKASRAGTRTSRVIRVIRLIRLFRIVKLYKNARKAMKSSDGDVIPSDQEMFIPTESRVGKKLSDLTNKRVISLVLLMLLILPLFEETFYTEAYSSWEFGITSLSKFYQIDGFTQNRQEYIDFHEDRRRPIIYLAYDIDDDNTWTWEEEDLDELRRIEKKYVTDDDFLAVFDLRQDSRLEAGLNIAKTVFVWIVLTLGVIYFTKDANTLVLIPIERMVDRVRRIAKNPLAVQDDDPTDILKLEKDAQEKAMKKNCWTRFWSGTIDTKQYETSALEDTIFKIGVLLALGFGEAGSEIIATNMQKGGDVDPMVRGQKICAIFGFCDIRQFTDTTEILQEGVMLFVNEIAQIVHGVVDRFQGAANKNIGDAFLLVWKFNNQDIRYNGAFVQVDTKVKRVQKIADCAFISFLKVNIKINRNPTCLKYRSHNKLNERMPNYQVKIGFGLHVGWAIEGAIGSEFKIDASYLSPNVNMASRLEAATKQYGVPLLISGEMFRHLTLETQEKCRHIDIVTVKGSTDPMELYTSDMDLISLQPSQELGSQHRERGKRKRKILAARIQDDSYETSIFFEQSKELASVRYSYDYLFESKFNKAMEFYIEGNWSMANDKFEECLSIKPRDGPSLTLIEFMGENGFKCPVDWPGYRVLSEK